MSIKVLVVDDSPLIRGVMTEILNSAPDIKVIGTAEDAFDARDKIKQLNPDVVTLDIEMPKMNGINFLKNLMRLRPMPVVMVSTLTEQGAPITLEALELGAVDYIAKPKTNIAEGLAEYQEEIHSKVRTASLAKIKAKSEKSVLRSMAALIKPENLRFKSDYVIAIGASTGGTEAIKEVVVNLPSHSPPVVITQHIPPMFSASFASRLDSQSKVTVHEASDNQELEVGHVYVAPGDDHLTIKRGVAGKLICKLDKGPPVNRHRPAVDRLFDSVVVATQGRSTGILLTGMGADGAKGLLNMRNSGSHTIAQNEASSVVWGMPGAAVGIDAAIQVLPLAEVAAHALKSSASKK